MFDCIHLVHCPDFVTALFLPTVALLKRFFQCCFILCKQTKYNTSFGKSRLCQPISSCSVGDCGHGRITLHLTTSQLLALCLTTSQLLALYLTTSQLLALCLTTSQLLALRLTPSQLLAWMLTSLFLSATTELQCDRCCRSAQLLHST